MVTLANAFAVRGYKVDLVLASAQGHYLNDVNSAVRVIDLKAGRVVKALMPLVRYLREHRPDAMLSAMGHANVVSLMARMLARVPVRLVVSERNTIGVEHAKATGLMAHAVFKLVPMLYRRADGICTVSKEASADLARFASLAAERVTTIYNPFDLQRIDDLAQEAVDHSWFMSGAPPVVLAIGRLTEQKGFHQLVRAFTQLRQTHDARLMILGEGPLRSELQALAAECGLSSSEVQMPGFVGNPYAYLARCRLFVLSSQWEGLPGALIEAMACGAPTVSTNCPSGPHEILEGGRWGRLVPVGDVQSLAEAMAATLDTPLQRLPRVRERANDFEQGRAVDAYLKILGF